MLRRVIGDEAFFGGMKKFYAENRFKKAEHRRSPPGDGTRQRPRPRAASSSAGFTTTASRPSATAQLSKARNSSSASSRIGDLYDVPVTVAVTYTDGKTSEFVVAVNESANEARFPLTGAIRAIDANPDGAAVAIIEKR